CAGGAVISPWTPPCSCGFTEGERRVNVSFTNSVSLQRDYKLLLNIKREEPQPIDKCQVCFWGQDITNEVMKGLKDELDGAKKAIDDSFGVVDLKPRLQQVWDKMNQAYHLYNMGWLQINPQRIHLDNFYAQNDSLNIFIGLSAKPVISFEKPKDQYSRLPDVMSFGNRPGFTIFLDAVLDYDSLSNVVNAQIRDKSFDLDKGPVKKKFIVKDCQLYGTNNEKMVIKVTYGGSENGVAYFIGKPVYDEKTRVIEIKDLDFDVHTKDFLVKSAGWIFNRRIVNEIRKYTRFDLSSYLDSAKVNVNQQLNREIYKGITSYGNIDEIKLLGVYPFSGHLVVRSNCSGSLAIKVDAVDFNF
ncbi:MAG: DUF4403 family protein, partial [Bacteroidetes bacterium]|nr:DUF4403 family protein [Bacteroidota bacterium]